jgi:hypothetical protein
METKCFLCTAPLAIALGTILSNKLQMAFHEEIQHFFALFLLVISRTNMHRRHKVWSPSPFMYTVSQMDLILRSIEQRLQIQFSMARKFLLRPLRRYDVKPI